MSGPSPDPSPGASAESPAQAPAEPAAQAFSEPAALTPAEPAAVDRPAASPAAAVAPARDAEGAPAPRKGPLSFLSGALTSGALAWACFALSRRVVAYYSLHPPHYEARVAQSIATALKTLIVGMTFLATFSFAFVGLGLTLVFVRSLLRPEPRSPA